MGGGTQDYKVEFGTFSRESSTKLYSKTEIQNLIALYVFARNIYADTVLIAIFDNRNQESMNTMMTALDKFWENDTDPYISGNVLYLETSSKSFHFSGDGYYYCAIGK